MGAILLTGGLGFVGSHTGVELIKEGYDVIIVDNLSNSDIETLDNIEKIAGKRPRFYEEDLCQEEGLEKIFLENKIESVIHFAGYKAVGESREKPLLYYKNNVLPTLTLLEQMQKYGVKKFVFSSSAAVYGPDNDVPYTEDMPTGNCTNPYGKCKRIVEGICQDLSVAAPDMTFIILRYFNPTGAHESGLLGETFKSLPNSLMSYICKVALGECEYLSIFGNDYPTPDGTGIRDYVHVLDLATGHINGLEYAEKNRGCHIFNLGRGIGYSVLDLVKVFEQVNGIQIPYVIEPRRPGDLAVAYADCRKAKEVLGWVAEKDIESMCKDSWHWAKTKWEIL